jgi:hypothetical protein
LRGEPPVVRAAKLIIAAARRFVVVHVGRNIIRTREVRVIVCFAFSILDDFQKTRINSSRPQRLRRAEGGRRG